MAVGEHLCWMTWQSKDSVDINEQNHVHGIAEETLYDIEPSH